MSKRTKADARAGKRILLRGIVQGVGFRPHVFRLAQRHGVSGSVQNTAAGVVIEAEGANLEAFVEDLGRELPPLARIDLVEISAMPAKGAAEFTIIGSSRAGASDILISPDVAICENCRRELGDPADRRHRYPFITCTDCGPRFSIIQGMPYDRPFTTMKIFPMCPACRREYDDPADRRYHAQPVSCFDCGPTLVLEDAAGERLADPIASAARQLLLGKVLAVKGIGGYHLACLASSDEALARLRGLKNREAKPFALMGTLAMVQAECVCSAEEIAWLQSPAAPIVLLRKRSETTVSPQVACGQNRFGFMLPYTPLHLLLLQVVGQPLVMTSANLADEPILYRDDRQGLRRLADYVLWHDRPIEVFCDDSVVQLQAGGAQLIRRSRGYVPFHLPLAQAAPAVVLGLGAMLKGTFSFLKGDRALVSPYIATLDSPQSLDAEMRMIRHFMSVFALQPEVIACDRHPGYPSRTLADEFPGCRRCEIQHHQAHIASLLAENREEENVIGVAMDGTGYGDDGAIWGGEFFIGGLSGLTRAGHLQYLFLPGGDAAVREPWRVALSLLTALFGPGKEAAVFAERFGAQGRGQLEAIVKKTGGVDTSSCGRLFDAAAVLLGIGSRNTYDGELPSLLQAQAELATDRDRVYEFAVRRLHDRFILDMLPAFAAMLADSGALADRAAAFHCTLADGIARLVGLLRYHTGITKVGLSGGVFQNLFLLEATVQRLRQNGFSVIQHRHVPCNDGGVSLGQAVLAARQAAAEKPRA